MTAPIAMHHEGKPQAAELTLARLSATGVFPVAMLAQDRHRPAAPESHSNVSTLPYVAMQQGLASASSKGQQQVAIMLGQIQA